MSKNDAQIVISKKTLIIALIVLLLLIAGAVTLALNWNNWFGDVPDGPSSSQTGDWDIDPGTDDWDGEKLPDKTDDAPAAGIKIPGYPSITLPKDQKTVNVALLNPEGNPCYFTFEIVLKETGESLYKSKLVPPGKAITEITMARALSAGQYEATIKISTTSLEDGSAMNGANVETVLIVK
ncbi:MAG: hypothetical protein IKA47_02715 [Oscillospiraceae bacterium]|nr:hypothetical protein [Oscillospiraceae bacterium]